MEEAEDDGEREDLEECLEDVSGGEAAEEEGEEGCEASVTDGSSNVGDCSAGSLLPRSLRAEVGVGDVDSVVHTETDGQHDVHSGEDVDGEAPEVEESHDVHQGDDDHDEDDDADEEVPEEEEGDDGHTEEGEEEVPEELLADDLVRLPGRVDLAVTEEVGRGRGPDHLRDPRPGRDVGLRPGELEEVHRTAGGEDGRGGEAAGERGRQLELRLVPGALGGEQELGEKAGELVRVRVLQGFYAGVVTGGHVALERSPPTVVAADDGALPEDVLQASDEPVHAGQVGPSEGAAVDLSGPEGVVILRVEVQPLPEVTLGRQQQCGVKLLNHPGPAQDTAGEEAAGQTQHQDLVGRAPAGSLVQTEQSQSGPGGPSWGLTAGLAGLTEDQAGQEGVPRRLPPPLVQRQPGREPGELQQVDAGQGYGRAHTERLQAGHLLQFNSLENISRKEVGNI